MVTMHKHATGTTSRGWIRYLPLASLGVIILILLTYLVDDDDHHREPINRVSNKEPDRDDKLKNRLDTTLDQEKAAASHSSCPYRSMNDLTDEELHPVQGKRHMVTPPQGGSLHLVCCQTTKGPFNALVHEKWAPIGAKQFLDMVKSGYFSSIVPLMRCLEGFLCQFGLNGSPEVNKKWRQSIPDDPNWLPEGPAHRKNEDGVLRFAHGYLAYAGSGKNSRGNQFIVSLKDVEALAGGSPWEVPWGELVGKHSFETFSKVYTGYGEKGPSQGKLSNQGWTEALRKEFPLLDYITDCRVIDEQIEES